MSKRAAGIDIGIDSVKVAVLEKRSDGKIYLLDLIYEEIKEGENRVEIIKRIFLKNKIRVKNVGISFSVQLATLRKLNVPFRDNESIQKIIEFEIQPLILSPIENMVLDFYEIQKTKAGAELLVSCLDKKMIEEICQGLMSININSSFITLDSFGLLYSYLDSRELFSKDVVALIESDGGRVLIDLIANSRLVSTRSISGSEEVGKNVVLSLWSFEKELNQKIGQVFLAQNENFQGIRDNLLKNGNAPVEPFNFLQKIIVSAGKEEKSRKNAVSIGVSLMTLNKDRFEKINFIKEIPAYRKFANIKKMFIPTVFLSAAVILFLFINLYVSLALKESRLRDIKSQTREIFRNTFPKVTNIVDENVQMKNKIEEAKEFLGDFEGAPGGRLILDVFRELSIRIPTRFKVAVKEMIIEGNAVKLKGKVNNPLAVQGVARELKKSVYFKEISILKSEVVDGGEVYFEIDIAVK